MDKIYNTHGPATDRQIKYFRMLCDKAKLNCFKLNFHVDTLCKSLLSDPNGRSRASNLILILTTASNRNWGKVHIKSEKK